jgi:carbamoyltransferase
VSSYVLGFSGIAGAHSVAYVHNPAAALLKDGRFVAGAAEERFNRIKNSPGLFPSKSIKWVLDAAGITIDDVDVIAWANDPTGGFRRWSEREDKRLAREAISKLSAWADRSDRVAARLDSFLHPSLRPGELPAYQRAQFALHFGRSALDVPFECVDHHHSHAASAFYPSGMGEATVITWDGSGDGLSCSVRHGQAGTMRTIAEYSDFSIGELYWAVHQYLKLSDEGSLMGLAAYGTPNGRLSPYVRPHDLWMDLATVRGFGHPLFKHTGYSLDVMEAMAPARQPDDELLAAHRDLAAELQHQVEEFCFEITRRAVAATGCRRIALAGGVALNAVFNGKLGRESSLCDELFVQPNPGDEGGALGAAYVAAQRRGLDVAEPMTHSYMGPELADSEIEETLKNTGVPYHYLDDDELMPYVAAQLAQGKIVGWAQGAMEWGPRALGNRSILADPRDERAGERVNVAVKYRDPWRPFAPSILMEAADSYLVDSFYSPFMITTFMVRPDRRSEIPAVVHADGSTRPQMVTREANSRFYALIEEFGKQTGTPILLNTSFNLKGEPIVRTTLDAVRTFFSSGIDLLVLQNYLVYKDGLTA